MSYEKKVSILGSSEQDLPIVVQESRSSSPLRMNEDYSLSDTMSPRGEGGHTQMYILFVQPFVDVLKNFKFAAMQFSNSLKLIWKIFTVFDKGEFEDEVDLYNERRQQINKQWQPLIAKAEAQLGRTDPFLKMSVLGPQVFFADKTFRAGLAAGKPIAEILTATGWDQLVNNFKTDFDPNENLNKNSARIQKNQKKIMKKLNRIFFTSSSQSERYYESSENQGDLMLEADGSEEESEKISPEESVKKFLQVSGLQDELDKTKIEKANNIVSTIPKIKKTILPLTFSSEILAAKNIEELKATVDKINRAGGNVKVNFSDIEKELAQGADSLAKQEDFRASFLKSSGKKNDAESELNVDENKILEKATNIVFTQTKESLNMNIMNQLRDALPVIEKSLKSIEIDDETLEAMKKDQFEIVRRAEKVYSELINSYKKIVENLNSAKAKR
jgi:hypothetical protein